MKLLFILMCFFASAAEAQTIFNLNVFDELQGDWKEGFRQERMNALAKWIKSKRPDIVVFQEAKGEGDAAALKGLYPHRYYIYETEEGGASFGYWLGARKKPSFVWADGFSFPGGVKRKTVAALWKKRRGACLGVLGVHLSYQSSEVRVKEAKWIHDWVKGKENLCGNWIVVGDFNADEDSAEIKALLKDGFKSLYKHKKPTVGAFNPIRQVYGKDIPSQTIDWAFGFGNVSGSAEVVLDQPLDGVWVSDHAGILIRVP
jgi:endonuclease/exonuclease/phosphatase family metal-dependent hydrolase